MSFLYPLTGFVSGIILAGWFRSPLYSLIGIIPSVSLFLYLASKSKDPINAFKVGKFHPFWISLMFLGIGQLASSLKSHPDIHDEEFRSYKSAYGIIQETFPLANGDCFYVHIIEFTDSTGKISRPKNIIIRLETDGLCANKGDKILFPTSLRKIQDNPNFKSSGYSERLRRKGIIFATKASVTKIKLHPGAFSAISYSTYIRDWLIIKVDHSSITRPCKSLLKALLLGDSSIISLEERSRFGEAGVAHILALSGMHVVIIMGFFMLILFPLNFFGASKWRMWAALIFLWAFVLLTGMAPSTVRAALMVSFVTLAYTFQRKNNALNALLGATFIILLFSPSALYDIGLQLSFLSVASIIYFVNRLNPIDHHKHPWWYYIIGMVLTSMVATAATWPLVSYYFQSVPMLFLPANLIILPLLPFYVSLSLVWLILLSMGFEYSFMNYLVDYGYLDLAFTVEQISSLSASLSYRATIPTIITWLAGILAFGIFLNNKKWKWLLGVSICMCVFSLSVAPYMYREKDNFIIIQNFPSSISIAAYQNKEEQFLSFPNEGIGVFSSNALTLVSLDFLPSESWLDSLDNKLHCKADLDINFILGKHFPTDSVSISSMKERKIFKNCSKLLIHSGMRSKKEKDLSQKLREAGFSNIYSLRDEGPLELNL